MHVWQLIEILKGIDGDSKVVILDGNNLADVTKVSNMEVLIPSEGKKSLFVLEFNNKPEEEKQNG